MDLPTFRELLTPSGQQALQAAEALSPGESDFLAHLTSLSRQYPKALASAALETAILRLEARGKFPEAGKMFFTRPALEQASSWEVASYRCQRFTGFDSLLDLGCSIGGDTLALSHLATTIGIDLDPLRLAMAQANLTAIASEHKTFFLQADLRNSLPIRLSTDPKGFKNLSGLKIGAFFDPARRTNERRVHSVNRYQPPLGVIRDWLPTMPALGVKLSPGVDLAELESYQGEVEFISLKGELKEAVLWLGPLKTAQRRATVLPGAHSMTGMPDQPAEKDGAVRLSDPRAYLYEPDPAILRAGLVRMLGKQLDAAQLDPDIAYLTADRLVETPFARAYQVEDWLPFSLKRLRSTLRQRGVERVTVKKRGSPLQPEALIHALRLPQFEGGSERVVFLTHLRGKPVAVICLPAR